MDCKEEKGPWTVIFLKASDQLGRQSGSQTAPLNMPAGREADRQATDPPVRLATR